jgi:hypothetical protein
LLLLAVAELVMSKESAGWARVEAKRRIERAATRALPSRLPARICGWAVLGLGVLLLVLTLVSGKPLTVVLIAGGGLLVLGWAILHFTRESLDREEASSP